MGEITGEEEHPTIGEVLKRPQKRTIVGERVSGLSEEDMEARRVEQVRRSKLAWNQAHKALRILHPIDYARLLHQAKVGLHKELPPLPNGAPITGGNREPAGEE